MTEQNDVRDPSRSEMIQLLPFLKEVVNRGLYEPIAPYTCEWCPFEAKTREPREEIWNDPSEAHYICPVVQRDVWGEDPKCSDFNRKALGMVIDVLSEAVAGR